MIGCEIQDHKDARLDINEEQLIQAVLSGEKDAYMDLVKACQERIYRYCLTLLADGVEAEEATQDVFMKGYESLPRFEKRSSFTTWIARIAYNHCMDILEKKARRKTVSTDELAAQGQDIQSKEAGVDRPALQEEEQRWVDHVLKRLKPASREILTLREVEGMSYEKIADFKHCSLDVVKGRLRRARQEAQEIIRHFSPQKPSIG